ncbi:hypothetical protein EVAR_81452_1 [Eumeta japonica]|uniref:Protein Skeletor n=1 Tax=Eumeta variegata TaxID=151549 RepID=A0A4C1VZ76_EUMVA|nr:hypothetical protein EVAR_81452_1 [Eumeta japonica]
MMGMFPDYNILIKDALTTLSRDKTTFYPWIFYFRKNNSWNQNVELKANADLDCQSQDDDGPYRGKLVGKINSYHHQVSGEVYAVDETTLLLIDFNYDGMGDDTFFWAGDSGRPGPQGFIIPNEHGRTNVLERYHDAEIQLKLSGDKKVSRLKWLAIYDIGSQNTFGDVYVPDDFDPPAPHVMSGFSGSKAVSSGPITFVDAKSFIISEFQYDGSGEEVYFWTGLGPQPSSKGQKIPDEYGYLEPLHVYKGTDVRLELPGTSTVFNVQWISIWDAVRRESLATLLLQDTLNLPPALVSEHGYKTTIPNCLQLHRRLQVSWEVFGNQITIQLAGQINEDEYMAFGVSGSDERSQMLYADVAVASRGTVVDYNITAIAPCVRVLDQWKGVCRDDRLGHLDSNQLLSASREDGLSIVSYRRELKPVEEIDREWPVDRDVFVVWAIGALDPDGEPGFHTLFPRNDIRIRLTGESPINTCVPFTKGPKLTPPTPWDHIELTDPALRTFTATLGPGGGLRGYSSTGRSPALVWYINGQMAPDLQLRRGLTYTFRVRGGNNPHSAETYHPLMITTEPRGGLERLDEAAQKNVRVLAGVGYTRRGRPNPNAVGPLCVGRHPPDRDRRRDDEFTSFRSFNRSLIWTCEEGAPGELVATPNTTWPDVVYYHSYTHAGMGGIIRVVDRYRRTSRTGGADSCNEWSASDCAPMEQILVQSLALYSRSAKEKHRHGSTRETKDFSRSLDSIKIMNEVSKFERAINELRDAVPPPSPKKKRRPDDVNHSVMRKEVCDVLRVQIKDRFIHTNHLLASKLFYTDRFADYNKSFPEDDFKKMVNAIS